MSTLQLPELSTTDASQFSLDEYLAVLDPELLASAEGRRAITTYDPLLFALTYLPHHLKDDQGVISFADLHLAMCQLALEWLVPYAKLRLNRDILIAPRETGKSTWAFLILPLWLAAHRHLEFAMAFADSATQAEEHLATFRRELDTNELLRHDFPDLCRPAEMTHRKTVMAARRGMITQANGFSFAARGVDSSIAGAKVGSARPGLILLDDIEPAKNSAVMMRERLRVIRDTILPMNLGARVLITGTSTMPGSIVHQGVKWDTTGEEPLDNWIQEENFRVRYFKPIVDSPEGERSIWPHKWSLDFLNSIRHTRSYKVNFLNDPAGLEDGFWGDDDITYGGCEHYGRTLLFVDPAVTAKDTSDYTGLAVVSRDLEFPTHVWLRHAEHVKKAPSALAHHIIELVNRFPDIVEVVVEANQGHDTWREVLRDVPVKLTLKTTKDSKLIRAQRVLTLYQRGHVTHCDRWPALEEQMRSFPHVTNDDLLDAVMMGVEHFLKPPAKRRPRAFQGSYG